MKHRATVNGQVVDAKCNRTPISNGCLEVVLTVGTKVESGHVKPPITGVQPIRSYNVGAFLPGRRKVDVKLAL